MRMSMTVVVVGSLAITLGVILMAVFVPAFLWQPQQTVSAHPMGAQEFRGYTIYYQNQCWTCHTIYSRFWDNSGYPKSQAGDFNFLMPVPLGSERTGPDLSNIGRKRSISWDIEHHKRPRAFMPNSIMPNFYWLSDRDLEDLAIFLFNSGDRVAGEQPMQPPASYTGQENPLPAPRVTPISATTQAQGWDTWMAAGLQEGKELYVARCLDCHGCAGNGLGYYASTLFITPVNFKAFPFSQMTDTEWFWRVSEGVPATAMPVWKMSDLTDLQRWHIIRYAQSIFAQPVARDPNEGDPSGIYADLQNPVPLSVSVLEDGKSIYLRECMICHNDTGTGAGPYSQGLRPPPPDFHDPATYNSFTDADYFWRISEGVPWTAMPAWKMKYSEIDRWKLTHYIRVQFTQTEPRPPEDFAQVFPEIYLTQRLPESGVTYEDGKVTYLQNCAKCHGLSGQGDGWLGNWLNPPPANFTSDHFKTNTQGSLFAKVSLGVQDTAMPPWNEFLFEGQRWAPIKYIIETFISRIPAGPGTSQYDAGNVAATFANASATEWTDEGNTISDLNGEQLYGTFCTTCHGTAGLGNTFDTTAIGRVPPFPTTMEPTYIFWRIREGVPMTSMYPFKNLPGLTEGDMWDLTAYVSDLLGSPLQTGGG